jgi:hypothetical protein
MMKLLKTSVSAIGGGNHFVAITTALKMWSTERELNPRILVLQTSALTTSPSVLLVRRAQ